MSQSVQQAPTVSSLGFNPESLGLNGDPTLILLNGSGPGQVFELEATGLVLRLSGPMSERTAVEKADALRDDHALATEYVGSHLARTAFIATKNSHSGRQHIVALQEFVTGIPLPQHSNSASNRAKTILPLLHASLDMYDQTGKIPAIAGIHERFDPTDSNRIIITTGGRIRLLDTTFDPRSGISGFVTNRSVAFGVRQAIKRATTSS